MKIVTHPDHCPANTEVSAHAGVELVAALGKLKVRLHEQFERSYPGRGQIIHRAVAEAEELAWETSFPHLFLPDFAEARLAEIFAECEPSLARAA